MSAVSDKEVQKRNATNLNCILIPTYIEHIDYVDKFLYSICKNTPNNIPIYLLVSMNEISNFSYMVDKYNNINVINFTQVMQMFENTQCDDAILLNNCGKYLFQSFKKMYGLHYLFFVKNFDNVIIFDSESFIIRDVDVNELINNYVVNPFILYSCLLNDNFKTTVESFIKLINDVDGSRWYLEYYLWVYEKNIFLNFVQSILLTHGNSLYKFFEKYFKTSFGSTINSNNCEKVCRNHRVILVPSKSQTIIPAIFIEVIYQSYIHEHNDVYKYNFIEFTNFISIKYPHKLSESLRVIGVNLPNKPIEDARIYIEQDYENLFVNDIYDEFQLQLYKTNNSVKSLDFLKKHECIRICVSEYSDIVFNHFFPTYVDDYKLNWKIVSSHVIRIDSSLYMFRKKTNEVSPFHWIGYELMSPPDTHIIFSFDLFFVEQCVVNNTHFIAFKKHSPIEFQYVNPSCPQTWHHYDITIDSPACKDTYLLFFDNAPICEILIKNLRFSFK